MGNVRDIFFSFVTGVIISARKNTLSETKIEKLEDKSNKCTDIYRRHSTYDSDTVAHKGKTSIIPAGQ